MAMKHGVPPLPLSPPPALLPCLSYLSTASQWAAMTELYLVQLNDSPVTGDMSRQEGSKHSRGGKARQSTQSGSSRAEQGGTGQEPEGSCPIMSLPLLLSDCDVCCPSRPRWDTMTQLRSVYLYGTHVSGNVAGWSALLW